MTRKDGGGIPADPHDYQGESLKKGSSPKYGNFAIIYTHPHVIPNLYGYVNIK